MTNSSMLQQQLELVSPEETPFLTMVESQQTGRRPAEVAASWTVYQRVNGSSGHDADVEKALAGV